MNNNETFESNAVAWLYKGRIILGTLVFLVILASWPEQFAGGLYLLGHWMHGLVLEAARNITK